MSLPLNPAQRAGVEHRGGPLLLLAGAGTGKTRVITHRVAALIDEGVPAWRILAVTFTNKAAGEMRERIAGLLDLSPDELRRDGPWIGTFHSICARILRRHGEGVGLSRNFAIYDADDQKSLMRKVLKDLDIDPRLFSATAALGKIDAAKNLGLGRERLHEMHYGQPVEEWTRRAWAVYEDRLRAADAADFGDLLTLTVALLRKATPTPRPEPAASPAPTRTIKLRTERAPGETRTPALGEARTPGAGEVNPVVGLRRRFRHVVVDEYQDTNPVQAELVDLLCSEHAELCVVGDDDQAIYGWRGADVGQILSFPDKHRGCELIRLEQNYRSTTLILDCANAVIRGGLRRHDKQLWSELGPGEPVQLHGFGDERDEARWAAQTVRAAIDDGESPAQIVVFYRTHAQSRPLEEAMRMLGLRYRMLGGIRFYDRREIKDLVAYLRLLTNPESDLDCLRIINVPARRIGAKTIERLSSWALHQGCSLFEACGPRSEHGLAAGLGKATSRTVKGFWQLIDELRKDSEGLSHDQVAALVLHRTAYLDSIREEQDGDARAENLGEFVGALEEFTREQPEASLAEYLEKIALATGGDDESQGSEAVTLMTVHSAKGLEFDRVILTGMEEGVFPHMRALDSDDPRAIEEERRLAYVAVTRARRQLALSYVERRFLWGRTQVQPPSRFLQALPAPAVIRAGLAAGRRGRAAMAAAARAPSWDDDIELDPEYGGGERRRPPPRLASARVAVDADDDDDDDDDDDGLDEPVIEYDEPRPRRAVEPVIEYEPEDGLSVCRGMMMRHPKYGLGAVVSWSGSGRDMKLTLDFRGERKTIFARFCTPA